LWADRFDADAANLFTLQDQIVGRIAASLNLELVGAEAARVGEIPDALDCILRGRAATSREQSAENWELAVSLFERALMLDPNSTAARNWLANTLAARARARMTTTPGADVERAEQLVDEIIRNSPRDPLARFVKGQVRYAQYRCAEAIPEYEIAVACNRNWVNALSGLGWCKFWTGSIDEGLAYQHQAIRLSPRDPSLADFFFRIGYAELARSHTSDAIVWLEKARTLSPQYHWVRIALASAYALAGDVQAASELAEARALLGEHYSSIARIKLGGAFKPAGPHTATLLDRTFLAGLRRTGVPEE
jgi:tetratricopeptide (TPR) repeat protein